jgi:hypothetical protein
MKLVTVIGITWGIIYFVFGLLSSFTINSIDTYSSIALLVLTFLLPLPLTVAAVWFPKTAAVALILCVPISGAIFLLLYGVRETGTAFSRGFYVPHLILGVAYIVLGWTGSKPHADYLR